MLTNHLKMPDLREVWLSFVILEFLTVLCTWDIGKTAEEAIRVLMTNHPLNSYQVLAYPLRVLEMAEVGKSFTLWRLFPWLDEN